MVIVQQNDTLFLFTCRTLWLREKNQDALEALECAAGSADSETRAFAQAMLNEIRVPEAIN